MTAPVHRPCEGCQTIGVVSARLILGVARRNYVRALSNAVAAGVPLAELAQDGEAFSRDMARVLAERGAS